MSEQGDRPNRPTTEDDWWSRLYDDSAPDTGRPTASADSLDDRFDSASGTVTARPHAWWDRPPSPPEGRVGERGVRGDGPAAGAPPVPARPAGPPPSPAPGGPGVGDEPQGAA
ncbi:protein phosphatase 2C domain-containing protein, partial [Streptomyces sp. NPDC054847]